MPKLEPISSKKCNLSHAVCPPKGGRAPPENPLHIFRNFPRRDFLGLVKGVSGGSPTASGRGGAAVGGIGLVFGDDGVYCHPVANFWR